MLNYRYKFDALFSFHKIYYARKELKFVRDLCVLALL